MVKRWKVLEGFTASDHQYISFEMTNGPSYYSDVRQTPTGWNIKKINVGKFDGAGMRRYIHVVRFYGCA